LDDTRCWYRWHCCLRFSFAESVAERLHERPDHQHDHGDHGDQGKQFDEPDELPAACAEYPVGERWASDTAEQRYGQ
jgi:hypothetical protein